MTQVSEIIKTAPTEFKSTLQQKVYETLDALEIPFERVDNTPAVTMEDCIEIDEKLKVKTVKTLFLCNRQKTAFYLFVTAGDKPFVTKDFGKALGVSRVSFAPAELLDSMLDTKPGATTVLSTVLDTDNSIRVVIDSEVTGYEYYGCTDGTATSYMRLKTEDVLNKYLPYTNHEYTVIEV
ncbi:MAG: prolyl-tRNA synthetase associated domain-containing protein [Eubacterium sp.]|nr:prolyl-tRNA synthetase associated domain-containing protein [Eubacterium sp.]